jgi:hypothetical protein
MSAERVMLSAPCRTSGRTINDDRIVLPRKRWNLLMKDRSRNRDNFEGMVALCSYASPAL